MLRRKGDFPKRSHTLSIIVTDRVSVGFGAVFFKGWLRNLKSSPENITADEVGVSVVEMQWYENRIFLLLMKLPDLLDIPRKCLKKRMKPCPMLHTFSSQAGATVILK